MVNERQEKPMSCTIHTDKKDIIRYSPQTLEEGRSGGARNFLYETLEKKKKTDNKL